MIDLYLHMQVRMLRVYRNQGKEIEYKNAVTCHWLHGPPIQCILYGTVTGGEGGRGPSLLELFHGYIIIIMLYSLLILCITKVCNYNTIIKYN